MKVLVTGTAGFVGYHLAEKLIANGHEVVGIDCVSDYYDVSLKEARLARLNKHAAFTEIREDLANADAIMQVFATHKPTHCVNLAAQAGVRYSLENPAAYTHSNIDGFLSILEACRHHPVKHLVFASTSSVYGGNQNMPFSEHNSTEHPMTLYAATKKANELMAHNYAHLFDIPATGMRFFTVYGPWGRPDMALFLFTKAIMEGKPINVFNNGQMERDFTYVEDIVEGIFRLLGVPPKKDDAWDAKNPDPCSSGIGPYRIVNIGNSRCEKLMRYIEVLEEKLGRKAEKNMLPMQDGDVPATWADTSELNKITGYSPNTSIEEGVGKFVDWYVDFYNVDL
ncbi:Protein CapI [Candidatus Terasakiella magnetica]|uniref:Protein CapI n=1 Tax=Candidatus Terasakiella magnetica TaxID=1867952 RepID=A0A1C3RG75_9PROT|nr:NAD-dependent epimerase [Candidatus Terasakiella magnetica]SCA56202.1 Protein CapI [Candidatus Terasakiella magnetica]